jgi:FkbM family methyltransferase
MKLSMDSDELFSNLAFGDIAIDCGANAGHVTQKMAENGATVYAFEPNPYAFAYLSKRFENRPNIFCMNQGVWHRNDKLQLYLYPGSNEDPLRYAYASSIFPDNPIIDRGSHVEIEVIDLTEFIQQLGLPIKLLKIDIEGAEFELLEKMILMNLHAGIEKIVVETHEWLLEHTEPKARRLRTMIEERNITNIDLNWN